MLRPSIGDVRISNFADKVKTNWSQSFYRGRVKKQLARRTETALHYFWHRKWVKPRLKWEFYHQLLGRWNAHISGPYKKHHLIYLKVDPSLSVPLSPLCPLQDSMVLISFHCSDRCLLVVQRPILSDISVYSCLVWVSLANVFCVTSYRWASFQPV